jgi:putative spermidine/putrescine transport system permease protein
LGLLLVAPPILLIVGVLFIPALRSIIGTLQVPGADGITQWSLANYGTFFSDPYTLSNLAQTFWTTFVTLFLLMLVNVPIALYLRFARGPLATFIQFTALFPMFVPGIVICYALIQYMGPNGLLQSMLNQVGFIWYRTPYLTPWGPVIGLVWDAMPFTLLVLAAGAGGISTPSIEAARDLGAGKLRIFWSIILPQMANSILVVCALDFFYLFSSVLQPLLLGPATPELMGPYMLRTFISVRDPVASSTQATVTFLICSVAGYVYVRAMARRQRDEGAVS